MMTFRLKRHALWVNVRLREMNGRWLASADTPDGPERRLWGSVPSAPLPRNRKSGVPTEVLRPPHGAPRAVGTPGGAHAPRSCRASRSEGAGCLRDQRLVERRVPRT